MKRVWCCFVACLWLTAQVFAQPAAPVKEHKKPLEKLDLQSGDSIVFLGDSITHQRLYTQYVEDYFYTRFPNLRLKIHNAGVGGARAIDALARFDQDVAAYKPKYVTILLGMNDGRYSSYNDEYFTTYQRDMTKLIDRIKEIGATPILITPTMFDLRAEHLKEKQTGRTESARLYNSTLAYYGAWLREIAQEQGVGFVDMWTPLNAITLQQRKSEPNFTLIPDAVHPGANGQVIMAESILNDLKLPKMVSTIQLNEAADGKWSSKANGGKLSELSGSADSVSFTFAAKALPLVLPPEAELGAKLGQLGHRFSLESLQVVGLAPGSYQLTIDGADCGIYKSEALARRVELQGVSTTPQYQQALKVAELNKKRNEGPIQKLRAEWSVYQRYSRAKQAAEENPQDGELKKQLVAAEEKIKGIEERVAQANADAKAIEDEIFKVNQPVPHKYVLTRVK
ncbi:SGNH/GDSL hydrolase family protein [Planctomicrobium sp. SH664]|uniref:SGNH/GDSL hydrolase family protein n=1 Tax=Planctomicrobium sp. SH664 TaxID=3448125 RepID=UPI003F5B2295